MRKARRRYARAVATERAPGLLPERPPVPPTEIWIWILCRRGAGRLLNEDFGIVLAAVAVSCPAAERIVPSHGNVASAVPVGARSGRTQPSNANRRTRVGHRRLCRAREGLPSCDRRLRRRLHLVPQPAQARPWPAGCRTKSRSLCWRTGAATICRAYRSGSPRPKSPGGKRRRCAPPRGSNRRRRQNLPSPRRPCSGRLGDRAASAFHPSGV